MERLTSREDSEKTQAALVAACVLEVGENQRDRMETFSSSTTAFMVLMGLR